MRIAIVNRHLRDGAGGSELQCDLIARELVARGHAVLHVVASEGAAPLDDLPYDAIRVGPGADAAVDACLTWRPDVVYWRMNRLGLPRFVAGCRSTGVPVVFASSHIDDLVRWPRRPWPAVRRGPEGLRDHLGELRTRAAERRSYAALRSCAALTVQREDLLGRAPVERQVVVRNTVSDVRSSFAWPRPYVAWVANLKRRKRPELIARIAERLAPHGVDVLVAGAVHEERYRDLLADAGGSVHHLGVLDQGMVNGLLAGARCVAVTAEEEGFSNVLIHAWWYGTATVTLEHDPDGLVGRHGLGASAHGDVGRLLDGIEQYATDPGQATAAGERAAAVARVLFDVDTNLDALEVLLSDVALGAASDR
jgi:glycosyltransferase involved in cell wall biosynthesis